MKIPFDIKYRPQIESGEYKVETRDGSPARIICWDRHATEPFNGYILVALITSKNHNESAYYYYSDGHLWDKSNDEGDSQLDLFIITPEPELTEFEEELRRVIVESLSGETPDGCGGTMKWAVYLGDDDIQKLAPKVMELAKKEICKNCTVGLDQYWKGREDARKEYEKSITYHYPTYWPPCHHGGICTNPMRDCINCPMHSSGTTIDTTSEACKKD